MDLVRVSRELSKAVDALSFSAPVTHVYNPLDYARAPHQAYLKRFGRGSREAVFVGMNPGPFGMAQTGVPFGEIAAVRDWMGIEGRVRKPAVEHPKRPIVGFECTRSEVSGSRLWGWAQGRFGTAERFFERFFISNYCPLVFMEEGGRNRTPDKLPKAERIPLYEACDKALLRTVKALSPRYVIGVGAFATKRARTVLAEAGVDSDFTIGTVLHPSPASPKANTGWTAHAESDLAKLGIQL